MDLDELDTFYRATTFLVYHPSGDNIPIRLGQFHPALDAVLKPIGETWAFLTACNPRSEVLADTENAARMKSLLHDVSEEGYTFWSGSGISDASDWKPEESLLVIGISKDEANQLAERYDQNAFVFGERGGEPELLWTRERLDRRPRHCG
jgi:hypothetical protein